MTRPTLTRDQLIQRRLAREDGMRAVDLIHSVESYRGRFDHQYRGVGSVYQWAREAAWHAFGAHPDLRQDCLCPKHPSFIRAIVGGECGHIAL